MKRFPVLGILLLVPALAMLGMVGCGDKGPKVTDGAKTPTPPDKTDTGKKVEITTPLDATVSGVVKLKGTAPEMHVIPKMSAHADGKFCLSAPKDQTMQQTWMVGKDNVLENVVVSLAPPSGKKYKIDDKLKELSKKTIKIDQPFCNYVPHVVAVWPEVQGVLFESTATVPHNVKIDGGSKIGNFNMNIKPAAKGGKPSEPAEGTLFLKGGGEVVIDASCSMHEWMNAKIALFTHPYIAVTKADGSFEIPNVPIGEELTVYLWHESNKNKVEVAKITPKKGANDLKVLDYPGPK